MKRAEAGADGAGKTVPEGSALSIGVSSCYSFRVMIQVLIFALLLVSIPAFGADAGPETGTGEAGEGLKTIRVLTYNIRHARGMDGEVNVRRIAEVIREVAPDVVGLQEVDRGVARTEGRDLTRELAAMTGMTGYFEKNHAVGGGDYGNAILSRFPILQRDNMHLKHIQQGEQRGILQVVVDVEGTKLLILNTHLAHRVADEMDRLFSVEQARELAAQHRDLAVIFLGDFNDRPGSRVHNRLKDDYIDVWEAVGEGDGFTHRSDLPDKRIDYIWLLRNSGLTPGRTWIVPTRASDHLPLAAEVDVRLEGK